MLGMEIVRACMLQVHAHTHVHVHTHVHTHVHIHTHTHTHTHTHQVKTLDERAQAYNTRYEKLKSQLLRRLPGLITIPDVTPGVTMPVCT